MKLVMNIPVSALTLLVDREEGIQPEKKLSVGLLVCKLIFIIVIVIGAWYILFVCSILDALKCLSQGAYRYVRRQLKL